MPNTTGLSANRLRNDGFGFASGQPDAHGESVFAGGFGEKTSRPRYLSSYVMKLSTEQAELFFRLMWPLQFFVKEKLGLLPEIQDLASYIKAPTEQKAQVRNALYQHPELHQTFLEQNPQGFDKEELAIVTGWQNFVAGDFFLERYLKSHAIFIGNHNQVYGVLGLHQGLEEIIHKSYLPLRTKVVLLPFLGKIVYDGLIESYNVYFGAGITRELKETYLAAKQNGRIITELSQSPAAIPDKRPKISKNWEPELEQLAALAGKLKSGTGQPALHGPAFSLVKASLEFASLAVAVPADTDKLLKSLKKLDKLLNQAENVLFRME